MERIGQVEIEERGPETTFRVPPPEPARSFLVLHAVAALVASLGPWLSESLAHPGVLFARFVGLVVMIATGAALAAKRTSEGPPLLVLERELAIRRSEGTPAEASGYRDAPRADGWLRIDQSRLEPLEAARSVCVGAEQVSRGRRTRDVHHVFLLLEDEVLRVATLGAHADASSLAARILRALGRPGRALDTVAGGNVVGLGVQMAVGVGLGILPGLAATALLMRSLDGAAWTSASYVAPATAAGLALYQGVTTLALSAIARRSRARRMRELFDLA